MREGAEGVGSEEEFEGEEEVVLVGFVGEASTGWKEGGGCVG